MMSTSYDSFSELQLKAFGTQPPKSATSEHSPGDLFKTLFEFNLQRVFSSNVSFVSISYTSNNHLSVRMRELPTGYQTNYLKKRIKAKMILLLVRMFRMVALVIKRHICRLCLQKPKTIKQRNHVRKKELHFFLLTSLPLFLNKWHNA